MTIDFWGLGLQAVNVLILVWLLSRVFWRPVAAAIARRQETTEKVIKAAKATQAKADAALAASIFHFAEYTIEQAKRHLQDRGIEVRL